METKDEDCNQLEGITIPFQTWIYPGFKNVKTGSKSFTF